MNDLLKPRCWSPDQQRNWCADFPRTTLYLLQASTLEAGELNENLYKKTHSGLNRNGLQH